jgi:hypothetical protein
VSAFAARFSRISRGWDDRSHDPAVRAGPAVLGEFQLEVLLTLVQIVRAVERFDAFGSIRIDDPQFVAATRRFARFVSQVLTGTFGPPGCRGKIVRLNRSPSV